MLRPVDPTRTYTTLGEALPAVLAGLTRRAEAQGSPPPPSFYAAVGLPEPDAHAPRPASERRSRPVRQTASAKPDTAAYAAAGGEVRDGD